LEAKQSDPVRHNPDCKPGQPLHSSLYSVSILAAIHILCRGRVLIGS
jgi:hypothetical protein